MNLNNCLTPNWSVNEWVFLRNNYVEKVYFEITKEEEHRLGKSTWRKKLKEFVDFPGFSKDPKVIKRINEILFDKVVARLIKNKYLTKEQIKTYDEDIWAYCQSMAQDEI